MQDARPAISMSLAPLDGQCWRFLSHFEATEGPIRAASPTVRLQLVRQKRCNSTIEITLISIFQQGLGLFMHLYLTSAPEGPVWI